MQDPITNEFCHELAMLEFDYEALIDICDDSYRYADLQIHQRKVADDFYMSSVRKKYPFLSEVFNVYKLLGNPMYALAPHVDAKRKCTLNIPIQNTEKSATKWFREIADPSTIYDSKHVVNFYTSELEESYSHVLTVPTLINTQIPHAVIFKDTDVRRISISWSISSHISYEEARKYFQSIR